MDTGICPGNYYDFKDDEIAIQREYELGDSLTGVFRDDTFPANARSLYFDPLNPPKGSLPNESIKWFSICEGEVVDCDNPVTFSGDRWSSMIEQGALGDGYFINAMRILSCDARNLKRVIVSDKFAPQGLYTFKFYKAGKWRYVHVDDRIPCRQSGKVNYCRNVNQNETYAMLLEKAYAKLHGCYEAIAYGLPEKVIQELTPAASIEVLQLQKFSPFNVCDVVWDALERGIEEQRLISCGRFIPASYGENPSIRKGITLGVMYQVVDVCASSAEPTEDLDALTVGMVCIRNLQKDVGRFVGRWSYGHPLWAQYKEIGLDLRQRTREIQFQRGLGPNPNDAENFKARDMMLSRPTDVPEGVSLIGGSGGIVGGGLASNTGAERTLNSIGAAFDADDEPDDLYAMPNVATYKLMQQPQPIADDLHWIQIEDFVEIFNRVFITTDLSYEKKFAYRRYPSKWLPADFIAGSGGAPIVITTDASFSEVLSGANASASEQDDDQPYTSSVRGGGTAGGGNSGGVDASRGGGSAASVSHYDSIAEGDEETHDREESAGSGRAPSTHTKSRHSMAIGSAVSAGIPQNLASPPFGNADERGVHGAREIKYRQYTKKVATINESFTDNPMYPFTVTESTTMSITLFQEDKRWNKGRYGSDPTGVLAAPFAERRERLAECMMYPLAIGFVVLRLSGLKMRVTEFKLRKVMERSSGVQYSNANCNTVRLYPGRYAIVPYTNQSVDRATEYVLHCTFLSNQVEFEIDDVIAQRILDDAPSDDEDFDVRDEDYEPPDDNDLLRYHEDTDDYSIMSFEPIEEEEDEEDEGDIDDQSENDDDDGSGGVGRNGGEAEGKTDSAQGEEKVNGGPGASEERDRTGEAAAVLGEEENARNKKLALVAKAKRFNKNKLRSVDPPKIEKRQRWEYEEDTEELGLSAMFGEVGNLAHYIKTLKQEVRKLHGTIKAATAAAPATPIAASGDDDDDDSDDG